MSDGPSDPGALEPFRGQLPARGDAAPQHAGAVVRDQVSSIVQAAEARAAELEHGARQAADAARVDARASARRILDEIATIERQARELRRSARSEADQLRAVLSRSALSRRQTRTAAAAPVPELDVGALSLEAEPDRPAAEDALADEPAALEAGPATTESAPEDRVETAADADAGAAEDRAGEADEVATESDRQAEALPEDEQPPEDATEQSVARLEPKEADGLEDGTHDLDEDARRRVASKSDADLAETYRIAVDARSDAERHGDDSRVDYWAALAQASVEEAANRSGFGEAEAGEGRRGRRRLRRSLEPLLGAREDALHERQPGE